MWKEKSENAGDDMGYTKIDAFIKWHGCPYAEREILQAMNTMTSGQLVLVPLVRTFHGSARGARRGGRAAVGFAREDDKEAASRLAPPLRRCIGLGKRGGTPSAQYGLQFSSANDQ